MQLYLGEEKEVIQTTLIDHALYSANAVVQNKYFSDCRFESSNLFNAVFVGCIFKNTKFIRCELGGSQFIDCQFYSCTIKNSNLSDSKFIDCQFSALSTEGDFSIQGSNFENSIFLADRGKSSILGVNVIDSGFRHAWFSHTSFSHVRFADCSLGECGFMKCEIDELDLWENSCRGISFIESTIGALWTPLQKLLGMIGAQHLFSETEFKLYRKNNGNIVDDTATHPSLETTMNQYIDEELVAGRMFETLSLILIQSEIGDIKRIARRLSCNLKEISLESFACYVINMSQDDNTFLFYPNADDIALSAQQIYIANQMTSRILTCLGQRAILAFSKHNSNMNSTARCVFVLNNISQYYFSDTYGISIYHELPDMHEELLSIFRDIQGVTQLHDVHIKRIENGSTKLISEIVSPRSFFIVAGILVLLGLKVQYSTGIEGSQFKVEYSIDGTFSFESETTKVNVAVPQRLNSEANQSLSKEDQENIVNISSEITAKHSSTNFSNITATIGLTPLHNTQPFKTIRQATARSGSWSIVPRLEAGSVWAQLDRPRQNL